MDDDILCVLEQIINFSVPVIWIVLDGINNYPAYLDTKSFGYKKLKQWINANTYHYDIEHTHELAIDEEYSHDFSSCIIN